jgi:succinate dehydrogenase/fumarate reductase flavoprotein subunit
MKTMTCDVLVIGGGGAALRAAIAAKEANPEAKVLIATKGKLGKSGVTATACSDRMAFHAALKHTEPADGNAWRYHTDDIYRIGGKVSDYNLAAILAQNGQEAFAYLDQIGVPFVKKNGVADQFVTDGSEYARACYTGPKTAVHIEEALIRRIEQLPIDVLQHCMVAKLVTSGERVIGALSVDMLEPNLEKAVFAISAGAVIMATGGGGWMYEHNVFPGGMTGDGYAMAYAAGAELVNMEFIQIGIASTKTKFNCSGSMMRAVPRVINNSGEEFLITYFPNGTSMAEIYNILFKKGASWPVSYEHKTHIIDIALYKEWQAGRKVYLDYSKNPVGFQFDMLSDENQSRYRREMTRDLGAERRDMSPLERLKEINQPSIDWFSERGVNLNGGDRIEVAACAQHFQGGVKINGQGRTTVPGLWAIGETAGGQHGANRPGGNALLDCQVFGKIAGEDAVRTVQAGRGKPCETIFAEAYKTLLAELQFAQTQAISAGEIRERLQRLVGWALSIVRTEERMKKGLALLTELKSIPVRMEPQIVSQYLELQNMLVVAEKALLAALEREESRGPHLRFACYDDNVPIPSRNPDWEKYIVLCQCDGKVTCEVRTPNRP